MLDKKVSYFINNTHRWWWQTYLPCSMIQTILDASDADIWKQNRLKWRNGWTQASCFSNYVLNSIHHFIFRFHTSPLRYLQKIKSRSSQFVTLRKGAILHEVKPKLRCSTSRLHKVILFSKELIFDKGHVTHKHWT